MSATLSSPTSRSTQRLPRLQIAPRRSQKLCLRTALRRPKQAHPHSHQIRVCLPAPRATRAACLPCHGHPRQVHPRPPPHQPISLMIHLNHHTKPQPLSPRSPSRPHLTSLRPWPPHSQSRSPHSCCIITFTCPHPSSTLSPTPQSRGLSASSGLSRQSSALSPSSCPRHSPPGCCICRGYGFCSFSDVYCLSIPSCWSSSCVNSRHACSSPMVRRVAFQRAILLSFTKESSRSLTQTSTCFTISGSGIWARDTGLGRFHHQPRERMGREPPPLQPAGYPIGFAPHPRISEAEDRGHSEVRHTSGSR
jgi:hypothetical protein